MRNRRLIGQMVLVTLMTLTSATLVIAEEESYESKAVEKIELMGGTVTRIGDDLGQPVSAIRFEAGAKFSDKFSHLLRQFVQLAELDLGETRVTDALLTELATLPGLERLVIGDGDFKLTDDELRQLAKLEKLRALTLWGMTVPNKRLQKLRASLPNVQVTQSGFQWTSRPIGAFKWAAGDISVRADANPTELSLTRSNINPAVIALNMVLKGNEISVEPDSILINKEKSADVPDGAKTIRICEHRGNLQIVIDGRTVHRSVLKDTPQPVQRRGALLLMGQ